MNKTIWALAFVVLACGVSFAIQNASVSSDTESGWEAGYSAGNITTEGGNVTNVTLDVNASTEKWAGIYGDVSGNLVLAEAGATQFMYEWDLNVSNSGEVCVSTNDNPTLTSLFSTATAALIDSIWGFVVPADADTAAKTYNETGSVTIDGTAYTGDSTIDTAGWETVAVGLANPPTVKDEFLFCVNITQANNYANNPVDFEMMVPTNESLDSYETYFFYVELQ